MTILCGVSEPNVRTLPLFSCDQTKINAGLEYEAIFHSGLDKLKETIFAFGTNQTDSQWWPQWGGVTGVQMYFWKGSVESIARMLLLAHEAGLTSHTQDYKSCLEQILDDIVPKALSGDGTIGYTAGVGDYQFNGSRPIPHERHAYLSMTRFMAFAGYAVEAIRKCGATAAQESKFQTWATQMQAPIQRFMNNMLNHCDVTNGGFSHMCTHPMVAACYWGEIGGYSFPDVTTALTDTLNIYQNTNGNLGSDLGHDADSMGNIAMIRDKQLCGGSQQPVITDAMMTLIGNEEGARLIDPNDVFIGASGVEYPPHIYTYALTKQFSQTISDLTLSPDAANFPNVSNNETSAHLVLDQFVTLASTAFGCASATESDTC